MMNETTAGAIQPGLRDIVSTGAVLVVRRCDGSEAALPAFDLYENAPSRFAGVGGQRLDGSLAAPDDPLIEALEWAEDGAALTFADGATVFVPFDWLLARAFPEASPSRRTLWRASEAARLPVFDHGRFHSDAAERRRALASVARFGYARLVGGPSEPGEVTRVIERFGFVRETNYGRVFDVRVETQAANLAFTDRGLEPHTDNPYRDPTPTLQLLHCLQAANEGGETILVDGFAAADVLAGEDPSAVELLARHPVRFAWSDGRTQLESRTPVLGLDPGGEPRAVRFNHRSLAPLDLPRDIQPRWRAAYRRFASILARADMQHRFTLAPGDVLIMDNERVLHGRTGYAGGGARRLQGAYGDSDGLLSTLAALEREAAEASVARIEALFGSPGGQQDYGETLSVAQHMLQAAMLARREGAPDALVAAALLHDLGWPLCAPPHEDSGAALVAPVFGEAVAAPIRMHVAAKRWLVAAEPDYAARLSEASRRTLAGQGGPMDAAERAAFEARPGFAEAVRLRKIDDHAKEPGLACPSFDAYRSLLRRLAEDHLRRREDLS